MHTQQYNNYRCIIALFKHLFYAIIILRLCYFMGRWKAAIRPIGGNDSYNFLFYILPVAALLHGSRIALCLCIMIYILFTVYNLSDGVKIMLTGHCGSCLSHFLHEVIACFMTFENHLRK